MPKGLADLDPAVFQRLPVHLWRVRLGGTNRIHFVSLDTAGHKVRPPLPNETPSRRWAAYGSSISQGFSASQLANPWTQLAATNLRYDLINLGFGGCCHAEPALADYLAERTDWNLCSLELGINLCDKPITLEEFRTRVAYMLDRLRGTHTDATIVVITPPLNRQHLGALRSPEDIHQLEDFAKILRAEVAARSDRQNLHLMEAPLSSTALMGCRLIYATLRITATLRWPPISPSCLARVPQLKSHFTYKSVACAI